MFSSLRGRIPEQNFKISKVLKFEKVVFSTKAMVFRVSGHSDSCSKNSAVTLQTKVFTRMK